MDFSDARGSFQAPGSASSTSRAARAASALSISASSFFARACSFLERGFGASGGGAAACLTTGLARLAVFAASARSSRTRTYSGQPPT